MSLSQNRSLAEQIAYSLDDSEGVVKHAMLVWDTGSLAWVKMTQPGAGGGGGDGALLDGVSSSIKATVFDYTNANPLAVVLRDTNGDYVSVGGGTQYSEDDVSVAFPIGTQLIARRRDALGTETSTDGDVTALNSTGKGELYVKSADALDVSDRTAREVGRVRGWDGTVANGYAALRFDGAAAPVLYLGEAVPGSVTSAGVWKVQKIDTTTGVSIQWADGNANYDNVWDNRGSLSYS